MSSLLLVRLCDRAGIISAKAFPHIELHTQPHQNESIFKTEDTRTIPLLHSNAACLSARHGSGSSLVCSRKHSDGRCPCLRTQSECRRQSFKAASSGSHVFDIAGVPLAFEDGRGSVRSSVKVAVGSKVRVIRRRASERVVALTQLLLCTRPP